MKPEETEQKIPVIDWLLKSPVQSVRPARHGEPSGRILPVFLIHEDIEHVARLPARDVDLKGQVGLFRVSNVGMIGFYLHVEGESYEMWLNIHSSANEHLLFARALAAQDTILFVFYVDTPNPVRTLGCPNFLRTGFTPLMSAAASMEPWTMTRFDEAKRRLFLENPDPKALWRKAVTHKPC